MELRPQEWPVPSSVEDAPIRSAKDAAAPTRAEMPDDALASRPRLTE